MMFGVFNANCFVQRLQTPEKRGGFLILPGTGRGTARRSRVVEGP